MHVEGGMMTQHMAHKTPPRVPPKPTSKSPPSFISKVSGGRQQSPSPVRHVKGPTPQPVRYAYWWILQMIQKWQKWWSVDFGNEKWMWPYCNEHLCCLQTCFSLHQSVCLSNQTSQVSFTDQETGENTKCSRLRIHTSPPGLSDHTNHHHHAVLLLQVSGSAEVLPPWKQGDYMAEASYTTMSSMTSVSSATQLHMEKHWEQQVTATREVRMETIVWSCMQSLFNQQNIQGSKKTTVIVDSSGVWTWMWQQTEVNSTHVQ